jgi:hypothetical protein
MDKIMSTQNFASPDPAASDGQPDWVEAFIGGLAGLPVDGNRLDVGGTKCTWCETTHDDPVRVGQFHLGAIARSLGADAAGASCAVVNQRARELGLPEH